MLGVVNKLLNTKSLLTTTSNILPLCLKQTFPPIIWIFIWFEGDWMNQSHRNNKGSTLQVWIRTSFLDHCFMTVPYIGFCQGIFSSSFLCYLWPQWLGRLLHFSKVPQYRRGSAKNRNVWKWEQNFLPVFVLGIKFYLFTFWWTIIGFVQVGTQEFWVTLLLVLRFV